MAQTFINSYPKLLQSGVQVAGLWLAHGDEPLLQQWLITALRQHWQQQNYSITRIELTSPKSWQDVLAELGSLSLFDDASALIVTGNHKPDKTTTAELVRFAQAAASGEQSHSLLWLLPKLDRRAQSAAWFAPFTQYGQVIDCQVYDERARQQILQLQAERFGLRLSQDAWQLLMSHTEQNLLSAYQTLWRLSYLFAPKLAERQAAGEAHAHDTHSTVVPLDIDDLQAALVSDAQFSVFDLSDAMLAGDAKQVVKIFLQLKSIDEPPTLILWAISKDMRHIMALQDGKDPQALGIWRSKQGLYMNAMRRHSPASTAEWSTLIYRCDAAIKGVLRQPAWELLLQAALALTGVSLFPTPN